MTSVEARPTARVLERLRAHTRALHHRIEQQLDAVERFTDPSQRYPLIARFAALQVAAEAVLPASLAAIEGLHMDHRCRAPLLRRFMASPCAPFPQPGSAAEALGMLYVLEGSTLGGRVILNALAARGIEDHALSFLDAYGSDTGLRWREFLCVLIRETRDDDALIAQACQGAVAAFRYAELILCEAAE